MIHWNVTEQEADRILNIIGQRPYVEVRDLIAKLLQQAQPQPQPAFVEPPKQAKPNSQDKGPPVIATGVAA